MFWPTAVSPGCGAAKSGMAIGMGWMLPWLTSTLSAADAGDSRSGDRSASVTASSVAKFFMAISKSYCPIICRGSKWNGLISFHWLYLSAGSLYGAQTVIARLAASAAARV